MFVFHRAMSEGECKINEFLTLKRSYSSIILMRGQNSIHSFSLDSEDFHSLCARLQTWAKNGYAFNILDDDLSLTLLKRLVEYKDRVAVEVLEKYVLDGLSSKDPKRIYHLVFDYYLPYVEFGDFSKISYDNMLFILDVTGFLLWDYSMFTSSQKEMIIQKVRSKPDILLKGKNDRFLLDAISDIEKREAKEDFQAFLKLSDLMEAIEIEMDDIERDIKNMLAIAERFSGVQKFYALNRLCRIIFRQKYYEFSHHAQDMVKDHYREVLATSFEEVDPNETYEVLRDIIKTANGNYYFFKCTGFKILGIIEGLHRAKNLTGTEKFDVLNRLYKHILRNKNTYKEKRNELKDRYVEIIASFEEVKPSERYEALRDIIETVKLDENFFKGILLKIIGLIGTLDVKRLESNKFETNRSRVLNLLLKSVEGTKLEKDSLPTVLNYLSESKIMISEATFFTLFNLLKKNNLEDQNSSFLDQIKKERIIQG